MAEPNAFEQQRLQRIAENKARLEALGLLDHSLSGAAEEQRRAARQRARQSAAAADSQAAAAAAALEPTRRSRRIRGDAVENAGMNVGGPASASAERRACSGSSSGSRQPRVQVDLAVLEAGGGDPSIDSHNLMRIRSMSEKALRTRIWKITRVDKLHSFVLVLDACGMAELAAEAREALSQLTGGAVTS